jgi:hypothetical protein
VTAAASVRSVVCGYCGGTFAEDRGQSACQTCPLGDGCRFVRCPSCGYENPLPPRWLERLRGLFGDRESR